MTKKERTRVYNNARAFILRHINEYGTMEAIEEAMYKYDLNDDLLRALIPRIRYVTGYDNKYSDSVRNTFRQMSNDEILNIVTHR